MRIFHSFDEFKAGGGECRRSRPIVTVGSFDGVHMGHQRLIADMRSWADEQRCETLILTFHLHPRTFMTGVPIKRITSVEHKLDLLASLGVDNTLLVHFDEALQATSARDFCANYLVRMFNCRGLLLGHNNSIGRGREGTPERVKEYGKELGFEVRVTPAAAVNGQSLSSSTIRKVIEDCDFAQASAMLGRAYSLRGEVISGRRLGRTIGVPTMNLSLEGMVHPPNGVYGVRVRLDGKEYAGAANIGVRPTVEPGRTEPLLEVHALDLSGDWYGRSIDVEFIFRVRDEQQFSGVEELRAELQRDIAEVRKRFAPDIIATVHFYRTEDGGRRGPTPKKEFRCPLVFEGHNYDCMLVLRDSGSIAPGGSATVPIHFLCPELIKSRLKPGSVFKLWDGKLIADGVVNEVISD